MKDPLLDLVAGLPAATLDTSRARRTRERCHRVLDRHAAREEPSAARSHTDSHDALSPLSRANALRQALRLSNP